MPSLAKSRLSLSIATIITSQSALADHPQMEEVLIQAQAPATQSVDIDLQPSVDSAQLLKQVPGANLNANGPLTSVAQYRGLYAERVQVLVNGMTIAPAGPNMMDAPLSYAPGLILQSMEVYRGAAPVSAAQESIGGLVIAQTWQPEFSQKQQGWELGGRTSLAGASNNQAQQAALALNASNKQQALMVSVMDEQAEDQEFAKGKIVPSEYDRKRYDLAYALKQGAHQLQLQFSKNETGDSGTAALPMDIAYIDGELYNLGYQFDGDTYQVSFKAYQHDLRHGMSNYHLRQAPMPAMWRFNTVDTDNSGISLKLETSHWKVGVDYSSEEHNSDISNPNNPAFFVDNFNGAEKQIFGVFAEYKNIFNEHLAYDLGLRFNRVTMEAGKVNGTPAMMMPPAQQLRDNFNQAEREQSDDNIDATFKLYYKASEQLQYYLGLAQKTRSASYQQKFLWLPLQATGGLADGRTYTGRVDLDAEVAHELDVGFDWQNGDLSFSPRVFYRRVNDYIQGTVSTNNAAIMMVDMMNPGAAPPLEFNNVDADLYGFDWQASYQLNKQWQLINIASYVRGKRDDISDNLYRIAPFNTRLQLAYQGDNYRVQTEVVHNARQDKVSATNSEQETGSSTIFNVAANFQLSSDLSLSAGIENLLDKEYELHLNGVNRAGGNTDIAVGERLPEVGRNFYLKANYQW